MSSRASVFSLPLLEKELLEQANRRKLFVIRVAYAVLLFAATSFFVVPMILRMPATATSFLGTGRQVFQLLMVLQFAGIYLFLPALTCGAIVAEKERNTLALLFLTRLQPWTIIFEKLGSRLIAMLNLLLTSLPLMAVTYALGGIQTFDLVCAMWFLTLTILQVGSYAILASAFCRSTPAAYVTTLGIILLTCFGFIVVDEVVFQGIFRFADFGLMLLFPPGLMFILTSGVRGVVTGWSYPAMLIFSIPTLGTVLVSLILAKKFLWSRAFLPPGNSLLNVFKLLDRILLWANNRFTFGVVLVKESHTLPDQRPIEWRETAKRSLGQFRYLVRILVVLEAPVLLIMSSFAAVGPNLRIGTWPLTLVTWITWAVATTLICVTASNAIPLERGRQTLDVLLTSPLTSRQILLEKMGGVLRVMLVCAIPLLTCAIFQTWWREVLSNANSPFGSNVYYQNNGLRFEWYLWHEYLAANILTIGIYLPLVAWLALAIGARAKSTPRAVLGSLMFLAIWCAVPMIVADLLLTEQDIRFMAGNSAFSPALLVRLLSPVGILTVMELGGLHWLHPFPYLAVLVNSVLYGACLWVLRRYILERADHCLGRLSLAGDEKTTNAELAPFTLPATS